MKSLKTLVLVIGMITASSSMVFGSARQNNELCEMVCSLMERAAEQPMQPVLSSVLDDRIGELELPRVAAAVTVAMRMPTERLAQAERAHQIHTYAPHIDYDAKTIQLTSYTYAAFRAASAQAGPDVPCLIVE